jgi:MFS family permease
MRKNNTDRYSIFSFFKISIANFLFFASSYLLLLLLPDIITMKWGNPVVPNGLIYAYFVLGMCCIGPFHNYLTDTFKRKYLCLIAFVTTALIPPAYLLLEDAGYLPLLLTVQGMAFGIAVTAEITLAIDSSFSHHRNTNNTVFALVSRLGMILGITIVPILLAYFEIKELLYISMGITMAGSLFMLGSSTPFRAPMGVPLFSFDRFLLPRGWILMLDLMLTAFALGMITPLVLQYPAVLVVFETFGVPFFLFVGLGYLFSLLLVPVIFNQLKNKTAAQISSGLILMIIAVVALRFFPEIAAYYPAILLGCGLGLITPKFLLMFVRISPHCQRGTANSTQLLAWEIGMIAGIGLFYLLPEDTQIYLYAIGAITLSLFFFLLIAHPYYKSKRVRK